MNSSIPPGRNSDFRKGYSSYEVFVESERYCSYSNQPSYTSKKAYKKVDHHILLEVKKYWLDEKVRIMIFAILWLFHVRSKGDTTN